MKQGRNVHLNIVIHICTFKMNQNDRTFKNYLDAKCQKELQVVIKHFGMQELVK